MTDQFQQGSIVSYAPRMEEGTVYVAIVQHVWPDGSLQLFVLHHQSTANVRAAHYSECHLLWPGYITDIMQDIARLKDQVNFLYDRLGAMEPPNDNPESLGQEQDKGKGSWPSSSSVLTSSARRKSSN